MEFLVHCVRAVTLAVCIKKLTMMSFRGTLRAEESLLFLAFKPREIPHFVRNDEQSTFSANCYVYLACDSLGKS
jgi:hypothetical protein